MKRPHAYLPIGCQSPETVQSVAQAMQDAYLQGALDQKAVIETMIRNVEGEPALSIVRRAPIVKKLGD